MSSCPNQVTGNSKIRRLFKLLPKIWSLNQPFISLHTKHFEMFFNCSIRTLKSFKTSLENFSIPFKVWSSTNIAAYPVYDIVSLSTECEVAFQETFPSMFSISLELIVLHAECLLFINLECKNSREHKSKSLSGNFLVSSQLKNEWKLKLWNILLCIQN